MKFTPVKKHSSTVWTYKSPSGGGEPDAMLDLTRQIMNYQTRLGAAGVEAPAPQQDENLVLKGLGLLDKPREMLWGAMFGENYDSGKEVIDSAFGAQQANAGALEKAGRFAGALGLEIVGDPLNYLTLGAGSLVKGALTGSAKAMAPDVAKGLAKQAMGDFNEDTIRRGTEEWALKKARDAAPYLGRTELETEAARRIAPKLEGVMDFDPKPYRAAINAKDKRAAIDKLIADGHLSGLTDDIAATAQTAAPDFSKLTPIERMMKQQEWDLAQAAFKPQPSAAQPLARSATDQILEKLKGLKPSEQKAYLEELGRMNPNRGKAYLASTLGDDFLKYNNRTLTDPELMETAQKVMELMGSEGLSGADKVLKLGEAMPGGKKLLNKEAKSLIAEKRELRAKFLKENYANDFGDDFLKMTPIEREVVRKNRSLRQAEYSTTLAQDMFKGTEQESLVEEVLKKLQNPAHPKDVVGKIEDALLTHYMAVQSVLSKQATGLSFAGVKLLSGEALQQAGDEFAQKILAKNPALAKSRDAIRSMFSTKYIKGVARASEEAFSTLNGLSKGNMRIALIKSKEAFDEYNAIFKQMPDGDHQRELLTQYIEEGQQMPGYLRGQMRDETVEAAEKMKSEFKSWLEAERRAGFKKHNVFTDENYMPHMMNHDLSKDEFRRRTAGINGELYVTDPTKNRNLKMDVKLANLVRNFDTSTDEGKAAFADYLTKLAGQIHVQGEAHPLHGLLNLSNVEKLMKWKVGDAIPLPPQVLKHLQDTHMLAEFSQRSGLKTVAEIDETIAKAGAGETIPFSVDELSHFKNEASRLTNGVLDVEDPLSALDGVPQYYELDGVRAYVSRSLQNNSLLFKRESLNNFLHVFAKKSSDPDEINAALLDNSGMAVVIRDLPQMYSVSMGKELSDATGAAMESGKALEDKTIMNIYRRAEAEGGMARLTAGEAEIWFKRNKQAKQAYIMPDTAYAEFTKHAKRQVDDGLENARKGLAAVHRAWKPLVTALRPDYHLRNLVSSEVQNINSVGIETFNPVVNWTAGRLMNAKAVRGETVTLAGQAVSMEKLQRGLVRSGTEVNLMQEDLDAVEKIMRGTKYDTRGAYTKVTDKARDFGSAIEDRVRAVNFVANTEKFMKAGLRLDDAMRAAGDEVKKYHFDYSDLTETEKVIKDTAMPFYTWTRKNMPLQLELFLNEPRRYANLYRGIETANETFATDPETGSYGELLPDWAKNNMDIATPFTSERGNPVFLSGLFPQSDLTRLGKNPQDMLKDGLTMLGPLHKTAIETAFNRSMLTGQPISEYEGQTGNFAGAEMNAYLVNALNQMGVVRNIGGALSEQPFGAYSGTNRGAMNLPTLGATNSLIKELDVDTALKNRYYEYLRKLQDEVQKSKDRGLVIPEMKDLSGGGPDFQKVR